VLRRYDGEHLVKIALPLGGIGTGTVALGGRGELRDWEIMNRPARDFSGAASRTSNTAPFFALFTRSPDGAARTRALIGPLDRSEYDAAEGSPVNHCGLPRFSSARFEAAYPFGQVALSDPSMPVTVRLKAFNPFVPGDSEASGLPDRGLRLRLDDKLHRHGAGQDAPRYHREK
jgi:uncharacterized protein (DUF608 family)